MASMRGRAYSPWLWERIATGDVVRLCVGLTSIGRINTDISIYENYVSRRHGEIRISDDDVIEIVDLNSVNGIYVNGVQLQNTKLVLKANDRIGIGCMDDCDDEPQYPVFRLKYMPLRRPSARLNEPQMNKETIEPSKSKSSLLVASKDVASKNMQTNEPALTSKAATMTASSSNSSQSAAAAVDIITLISDDEDDNNSNDTNMNESHKNVIKPATSVVTNDKVTSSFPITSKVTCDSAISSKQNDKMSPTTVIKSDENLLNAVASPSNASCSPKQTAEKVTVHEPILPQIKHVHKNLNRNQENMGNLRNGDCFDLSSDTDDEDSAKIESLGAFQPVDEAPKCDRIDAASVRPQTKSPNIFETSLNSSKENEVNDDAQIEAQKQAEACKEPIAKTTSKAKRVNSYEIDEDSCELLSQILMDDIKAEMISDNEDNVGAEDNLATGVDDPFLVTKVKSEPTDEVEAQKDANNLRPSNSDCWIISDDEEYDDELENKVSDWSSKLLSQKLNMSQAYELPNELENDMQVDREAEEDCDDRDDEEGGYNDFLDYFYNKELDDEERIVHDVVTALQEKNGEVQIEKSPLSFEEDKNVNEKERRDTNDSIPEELMKGKITNKIERKDTKESLKNQKVIEKHSKETESSETKVIASRDEVCKNTKELSSDERDSSSSKNHVTNDENKCADTLETSRPNRVPPCIIDAPKLPKHRGKLRGVSAVHKVSSPTLRKKDIRKKAALIVEQIKEDHYRKELKQKWIEKPNEAKRHEKEKKKLIQASRKERLKELAGRQMAEINETQLKRKLPSSNEIDNKKAKVKITAVNRGAFLTEEIKSKVPYKIPKVNNKECAKSKIPIMKTNNDMSKKIDMTTVPRDSSTTNSKLNINGGVVDMFGLALQQQDQKIEPSNTRFKTADAVRAQRTTNKITFASMQKNYAESCQNQEKLEKLSSYRSCLTNIETRNANATRVKKCVRFNDSPMVFYIDRVYGANKKVNCKDLLPKPPISQRRQAVRELYPIVNHTDRIISMFLTWSNEWLVNRNAQVDAATDVLLPMPTQFSSFNHYKSIVFPLMRLEFIGTLEREKKRCKAKEFKVTFEQVLPNKERLMIFVRSTHRNMVDLKTELVILDWGKISVFAYLVNKRKTGTYGNTLVYEVMAKDFPLEKLRCIKEITIWPVIENLRVEMGAFNAVFQLEKSPLFGKIINPLELCKNKPVVKRKIRCKYYDQLNVNQQAVLLGTYEKIISGTPNITLIQGPPGTGKSCVISNLVLQLLYGNVERFLDQHVLVCAQSNAAVDVIAQKLYDITKRMRPETMFSLIRYGMKDRINSKLKPVTLEHIIERAQLKKLQQSYSNLKIPGDKDIKEYLRNEMKQLQLVINAMKANNINNTVQEDELLQHEKQLVLMQNIVNGILRPEDERSLYTWHLEAANVVCATLSSCVKLSQYVNYFDVCIIDEATQCTEPWTLLPLRFGINSLVLVGDTQQLPATVISKKASDFGLGRSLFTRIQNCIESVKCNAAATSNKPEDHVMFSLQTQYRMHPEICKWPNSYFYKNELINGSLTLQYKTPIVPFSVLNLTYTQNDDCMRGQIANEQEARFVAKLVQALDGYIPMKYNTYGVITPYAQQRATLERALRDAGYGKITVNTIDSYQGTERDVIIISNARTEGIGFLCNYQRLNVALTRPKKCLILCGNFKNLESVPAWRSLLNSARERHVYHEISSNCMDDMHRNVIAKIKVTAKKEN